jgi:hypothetical protein
MKQLQSHVAVISSLLAVSFSGCSSRTSVPSHPPDMVRVVALRDAMSGGASSSDSASDGAATSDQQPTGWATLKGRFSISGSAPKRLTLNIAKDTEVCAPGGTQRLSEEVIVGKENGIRNIVVFLAQKIPAEEPWSHPEMAPGKTDDVVFDQKECIFLSHVLPIQTTQRLKILNSDPVGHNTKLSPKKNALFDRTLAAGSEAFYQASAEEPAPFPVVCAIHPWMNAWLMIRDNSYIAVTSDDGTFEIPNLPTGVELEFRVWQEKTKFLQEVSVNGQQTQWKKGRVQLTLDPNDLSKNELNVVVDSSVFN